MLPPKTSLNLRALLCALLVTLPLAAQGDAARDREDAARAIDRLVERHLKEAGQSPLPTTDDATFLRRAYLGLVGRIPSLEEAQAFLASRGQDRRADLVRELIGSKGFQSHFFNWWADLLRVRTRLARRASGEPYMHWLKESLERNKPYDDMVREMLTAEGAAHARGNGATGYVLRDLGMPEDNMANTVRVFLGTRLECAQCHDHPSDRWKQKEFFQMVAFAGGVGYDSRNLRDPQQRRQMRDLRSEAQKKHGREGLRALNQVLRGQSSGVRGTGTGVVRLPKDYQYDDAKPLSWVTAQPIFGEGGEVDVKPPAERRRARQRGRRNRGNNNFQVPQIGSRAVFADWVTGAENPRFAKVIANRMWKHVMGRGLIEPVDDIRDDTVAADPELMAYLENLIIDLDFDLQAFLEVLWMTKAAQRQTLAEDPATGAAVLAGMPLRRLSAEQMWDSFVTLAVPDVDKSLAPALSARTERVYGQYERMGLDDQAGVMEQVDLRVLRTKDPAAYRRALRERVMADPERMRAQEARRDLQRRLREARRRNDLDEIARLRAEAAKATARGGRVGANALIRASDLPAPAPLGHFLRQFGQSDRETIGAAHTEPSIPQVLQMLNGFIESRVLADRSGALALAIQGESSTRKRITLIYEAILSRRPTSAETSLWRAEARKLDDAVWADMIWTLTNTQEFRFVR